MNSSVGIKKEMHQEGTIFKKEFLFDGDSSICSIQDDNQSIAVKPETTCDCPGDCDVCLEALLSASDEEMVAEPVEKVSVASTFNYPNVPSHLINSIETNSEPQSDAMIIEEEEPDQNGSILGDILNKALISIHGSTRNSAAKIVNYAETLENFVVEQQDTLAETRKGKRSIARSGKSSAPKRTRNVPSPEGSAQHQVNDDSNVNENDESESGDISLSVLVRYLNCRVPGCRKKFKNKVQHGHLLAKHAIEKYACKVKDCTESYATRGEFKVHLDTVHGHLGTNWPCGQCETICTNYPKLRKHVYLYHVSGLFACSVDKCNFTETTRIKMQNHKAEHRLAKYHCTFAGCSSSFYLNAHLTVHFRTHTKEKPFLCSQCPKAFSQKSNLTTHELTHSGLKSFSCSQCPKTFSSKGSLTVHELTHSGLKLYSCTWPHCGYSSNQRSNVISHVRMVHFHLPSTKKEQTEKCIIDDRDPRLFVAMAKSVITGN